MDCWYFKPDMRPSFSEINEKLSIILEKYENQKLNLTKLKEIECPNSLNETKDGTQSKFRLGQTPFKNQPSYVASPFLSKAHIAHIPQAKSTFLMTSKLQSNETKRGESISSKSEDSQYFSGADSSQVYADSSNFSSANSEYSNYSVAPPSMMTPSSSAMPPSPPPIKSLSKLLNVASAAYKL